MVNDKPVVKDWNDLEDAEQALESVLEYVKESIAQINLIKKMKPPKRYYLRHGLIKEDMSYLTYFTYGDYSSFVFGNEEQTSTRQTQFTEDEITKLDIPLDGLTMVEVDEEEEGTV